MEPRESKVIISFLLALHENLSVSKLEMISWLLIFVGGMAVPGVRAVS